MTREQILNELRIILQDTFEIEPQRVTAEANLFVDLELDSIDAVDLAIKLQQLTGKRIKPDGFKTVRTVDDVITAVEQLLAA
ncbi:acyl carrier protein [Chromobacterium alkanivorans]|jgi:acyl carrier protein|uniref:Acyl carrier protein n=1 Tax=Chromobacterium haemolyticum TaxID=394935 RepID=A0ABS3GSP6_9NEIS|nr:MULTISPECIES: acyl carrier protein [Chromobacterium]MBK0416818.1 acyl carrier protein [Chromobacterium haemolyticum]MBN3005030.1 acyl carrier protein [Chromobacterium alkanivorans]MBO0417984.1 acyl carrier protein [Chromobacterium haemolyticum]MBO0501205.1 acyl carrier protein [Chromobacterium haemolyticum]MCS3806049.1 acyl carrier protein [Chromobacterium alkanivorans]